MAIKMNSETTFYIVNVPVSKKYRQQFYNIIKNSNLSVVSETELSEQQFNATIRVNSCEDAYWLGRNHELIEHQ